MNFHYRRPTTEKETHQMGYWYATAEGRSLQFEDTGIIWGDEPADIMGDALDDIIDVFVRDRGRVPTEQELIAGVRFSAWRAIEDANERLAKSHP
jgi:hypothetical protein